MNFLPGRLEGDTLKLPFGETQVPEKLRSKLQAANVGGGARDVIVGIRPEHFEDAAIESETANRLKFKAKADVVESMGSELYVYFDVETQGDMHSADLDDLAKDSGMEDLPSAGGGGQHVVARVSAGSRASAGGEIELVLETDEIKLFDPEGGRSLTYGAASGNGDGAGAGARAASAQQP
jgi:multiple sugar transport system ATP-binding protein